MSIPNSQLSDKQKFSKACKNFRLRGTFPKPSSETLVIRKKIAANVVEVVQGTSQEYGRHHYHYSTHQNFSLQIFPKELVSCKWCSYDSDIPSKTFFFSKRGTFAKDYGIINCRSKDVRAIENLLVVGRVSSKDNKNFLSCTNSCLQRLNSYFINYIKTH